MKILVAYDGTLQSREALKFGLKRAGEVGARLMVLQVFDSNMFIDYEAGPKAVEFARTQSSRLLEDAKTIVRSEGGGVQVRMFSTDGDPEESVLDFAQTESVDVVICPPRYRSIIKRYKAVLDEQGRGSAVSLDASAGVSMLGVKAA